MMYLGTDNRSDERRGRRTAFGRLLAVLADRGPARLFDLAEACGDDPTLAQAEDVLLEAANQGFVAEAGGLWRIIATEKRFSHQQDAAERLRVGASTVSRWVATGLICDPPAVYIAQGGLVTFPKPRPVQASLPISENEAGPQNADSVPPASSPPAPAPAPVSRPPAPTPPVAPSPAVVELPLAEAARLVQALGNHPAAQVLARRVIERVAQAAA